MKSTYSIRRINNGVVETTDFIDDKVFLSNEHYREYFGKTFNEFGHLPWKRGIIKIKNGENTVRLMFHSGNSLKINSGTMGLSLFAMQVLKAQDGQNYEFVISRGSRFLFMWNHPSHLTRIGFKYAFILGALSSIIGIISCFC